jgi:MFS family permease
MTAASMPMFVERLAPFVASRLLVGAGEGAMMSAAVLWLLRLAGPERRGRALGHIGLANYAGLTAGPLLADAVGGAAHPARIFAAATVLPLVPLALTRRADAGPAPEAQEQSQGRPFRLLLRMILKPGIGLLLVNVGYATLLAFGAEAIGRGAVFVLPAYALTVIVARTLGAGIPDRFGGRTSLTFAAPTAAAGLLVAAFAPFTPLALAGVVVLGIGQGFAVPALGLLALEPVPPVQQGAASGLFFAWFDAGVAVGGTLSGVAAAVAGPEVAMAVASGAVALATAARGPRSLRRQQRGPSASNGV